MRLEELPERMVIVGGGYVAAEFAHVFSSLGTRVTQVHRGPVLLREHTRRSRTSSPSWRGGSGTFG
jgi:mycothione reductase